jgi:methyl-accepting chemotaxis protein
LGLTTAKLTIGKKILLGYVLAMTLMAITGFAGYRGAEGLLQANRWVRHTFLVIGEAQEVRAGLLDLENAGRGYVLSGDDAFLESTNGIRQRLARSRKQLRELTVDNPVQQRRLDELDPVIERGLADFTQIVTERREKGFAAAQVALRHGAARERMAQMQNSLTVIEDQERTLLNERERRVEQSAQDTNQIILYGNLLGLLLAALIGVVMHFSVTRPLADFQHFVTSVGEGDLTQKSAPEGGDELGKLGRGLNQMVTRLRTMATQTRAATENLGAATMQILASAREQAAITGQQVAAYQETNATMQEVSQSGLQIAERAKQVTVTAEAVSIANTSGLDAVQKANQTVEAIHEQAEAVAQNIVALSEKTQMVGDILATVNDIAEQSHLLALNAAIEAAAAGEHGRSFSVVAGEIKNLADQSKAATVQVKTILGDIQKEINTSVMLTEEAVKRVDVGKHQADVAASAIRNMAANIDQSVQAFQQIVAGTNQQQIGFENVMQALKDMSRGSEQAASSTRQTEKAAANLTTISSELRTATERYRL